MKPWAATVSGAPGSAAGHNSVPSRDGLQNGRCDRTACGASTSTRRFPGDLWHWQSARTRVRTTGWACLTQSISDAQRREQTFFAS